MARRFLAVLAVVLALSQAASAKPWLDEKFNTDGNVRTGYDASGQQVVTLSLDQRSGAGFNSDEQYLYGEFSIQMKLIPGNSAGTVSCFYLSSGDGDGHDEIDMEFMGNSSGPGHPVVLNTNVWVNGDGKKEHQFNLWFDPAADFHTYTIIWNPENILFKVDNLFIRSFKRFAGIPYTSSKPMRLHATLWDGSFWATEKGKVPIDWSNAPFNVLYRNYYANACVSGGACHAGSDGWMNRQLNGAEWGTVKWAERSYMSYNYCEDGYRFPQGFPAECSRY
ncbi:xyloglucan endotransglycosylase/hydrolase protein 8-like [Triticum urartu]|uniref:Xyloglucan endotransglucosylase/hydrolase n=1 Tax=Triticum urartu TaxID=4572 RepID=A0A8R7RH92_TRIUA|nr:xyloglucan endotransglycosylase/hydrolase protein 8-like [Triticum urartu]XP_048567615.1 xyloglucan endotransglycosylase/hydrolase protein 8-like [Triticum urartu]XP_048567617.1 xyloglucan endotransglycosylase/hydrolase protein 8-like [Triticum urartu]